MGSLWNDLIYHVDRLNTTHWVLLFGVAVVVCAMCLRGHGSHSNY